MCVCVCVCVCVCLCIYRVGLPYIAMYRHFCTFDYKSLIQSPNNQSKLFILFSILICVWRPNFIFFLKFFTNLLDLLKIAVFYGPDLSEKQRFSIYLKNSKKF